MDNFIYPNIYTYNCMLMRMKDAGEYSGLHPNTLRKHIDSGILKGVRIGKHRFIDTTEIDRLRSLQTPQNNLAVIYARVSTHKQEKEGNLERQKERLATYCNLNNVSVKETITEVASGVNEKRKGLQKLFKLATTGKIGMIVVEYKDRLARIGFEYLKTFFESFNVKIVILDQANNKSPQEELVGDLIAIVSSFSARIYGKRGAKRIVNKVKEEMLHAS